MSKSILEKAAEASQSANATTPPVDLVPGAAASVPQNQPAPTAQNPQPQNLQPQGQPVSAPTNVAMNPIPGQPIEAPTTQPTHYPKPQIQGQTPQNNQPAPEANQAQQPANQAQQPANQEDNSLIAFLKERAPDLLNNPSVSNMGAALKKLGDENRQLKSGAVTPTKELEELRNKLKELEPYKIAADIENTSAFQQKFYVPKAQAKDDAVRLAGVAGIAEDVIKQALNSADEITAAKYLAENVDDETTRRVLEEHVRKFVNLGRQEQDAISEARKDPITKLEKWQKESKTLKGKQARGTFSQNMDEFLGAVETVSVRLNDPTKGDPLFRDTQFGQDLKAQITNAVAQGHQFTPEDMAQSLMYAQGYPMMKTAYLAAEQRIAQLESDLAKFTGASFTSPAAGAQQQQYGGGIPSPAVRPQPHATPKNTPMKFRTTGGA